MRKTNYHTHYSVCDGKGQAEDFVEAAITKGFDALGFSSHAPVPFETETNMKAEDLPRYIAEIRRLQEKYRDKIEIYLGLELDYIHEVRNPADTAALKRGLDFTIGSLHVIKSRQNGAYRELDYTPEGYKAILEEDFGGDISFFVRTFYEYVAELLGFLQPAILGHLDLIKKNNPGELYFKESSPWYQESIRTLIPAVKKSGAIVEVNTGGLARKRTAEVYPSPWIVRLLHEAEIPVMLNSDAHSPENLDAYYDEGIRVIREAGYREVMTLRNGDFKPDKI